MSVAACVLAVGVLLAVAFFPGHTLAAFGPINGPYSRYGGEVADAVGNTAGIVPALAVAFGCGVVLLPADLYMMATTDASFGSVTKDACVYPAGGAFLGIYVIAGAPFFAIEKLFWDIPRDLIVGGDEHPGTGSTPGQPPAPSPVTSQEGGARSQPAQDRNW